MGLLHYDRVSTTIKPSYPSMLLPCLLPGRVGGMVPLPSSSIQGRGVVSYNFHSSAVKVTYIQDKEAAGREWWSSCLSIEVPAAAGCSAVCACSCNRPAAARAAAPPRPRSREAGVSCFGARAGSASSRASSRDAGEGSNGAMAGFASTRACATYHGDDRLGMKRIRVSSRAVEARSRRGTLDEARHLRRIRSGRCWWAPPAELWAPTTQRGSHVGGLAVPRCSRLVTHACHACSSLNLGGWRVTDSKQVHVLQCPAFLFLCRQPRQPVRTLVRAGAR